MRPKDGQSVGEANLSRSLTRALEGRGGSQRYRRSSAAAQSVAATDASAAPRSDRSIDPVPTELDDQGASASFRDRLNAIDLR